MVPARGDDGARDDHEVDERQSGIEVQRAPAPGQRGVDAAKM